MNRSPMARKEAGNVLVYDIGGSHISAATCHLGDFTLSPVASATHPTEQTFDVFLGLLHSLGSEASNGVEGTLGAQLAVPGPFDLAAGVSGMRHKLPYLYGMDLRSPLAACFGWRPERIQFINDADAFLLGEMGTGACQNSARAVGITLGTGVGSAFGVNGHVVTEGKGVPSGGEICNLPYGNRTVEDFVSSRAILRSYECRAGKPRLVAELATIAEEDPLAKECFIEFGRHLGRVMHSILSEFAPSDVVLGGSISRSAHLFLPAAQSESDGLGARLRVSTLLYRAALVGAGVAWSAKFNN